MAVKTLKTPSCKSSPWTTNDELRVIQRLAPEKRPAYLSALRNRADWDIVDSVMAIKYIEDLIDGRKELPSSVMRNERLSNESERKYIDNLTTKQLIYYIENAKTRRFNGNIDKKSSIDYAHSILEKCS